MKIKNITKSLLLGALVAASMASCDSDMEEVYVRPSDDITLSGATDNIILSTENSQALVLTIYWTGDGIISLSDTTLQAPINAATEAIEFASDEQFSDAYEIDVESGTRYRQFLGDDLNSILSVMGFTANQLSPLYIRVRSRLAPNVDPTYSNVLMTMVQPYSVSLATAKVLDSTKAETDRYLYSPNEDGIYTGFLGVGAWYNWWLLENNNFCWGNLGEDRKSFYASKDSSAWNFWFPGTSGCYYTTVNTNEEWWSALLVQTLTVSGDITGEMTYSQKTNQWTLSVNQDAGTYNVVISGEGLLYNMSTTADGPGLAQTVGFGGTATALTFGEQGESVAVTLPGGETTLILDLNDYLAMTLQAGDAAPEPEIEQYLYFSGIVNWDFEDYLTLYDEDKLCYGGAQYFNSEWGYRAYTTKDDWGSAYTAADGATALSGSIVAADGDGNIPAPESGLYVMDFSMSALTYTLTKVETVSYAGLNDDWTVREMTQSADNPEIFTAEVEKSANTPWGVKILINGSWDLFFGGGSGVLLLSHDGFDGDNDLANGTYVLTVDLGKQTYSYSTK